LSRALEKICKRQTAIKTSKPLAQMFVIQLRDKCAWEWRCIANQLFRDCPAQLQPHCVSEKCTDFKRHVVWEMITW